MTVPTLQQKLEDFRLGDGSPLNDDEIKGLMQTFATFLEGFTEEQKENIRISNGRLYGEMVSVEALHQVVTALRGGE